MGKTISERFALCIEALKRENRIRSIRHMAQLLNFSPQSLNEIYKGNRDLPMKLFRECVQKFNFNPVFILSGEGTVLMENDNLQNLKILSVITDNLNNERICHVPYPAQAGYPAERLNQEFLKELDSYSLPDLLYQNGSFRSFDVAGDSMEPTLFSKDKLICSYVEPSQFLHVKDDHVYVVVTMNDLFVKRISNQFQRHNQLVLRSDNDFYKPIRVHKGEIQELWYVRSVLRHFDHSVTNAPSAPSQMEEMETLRQKISEQANIINNLSDTLRKLVENSVSIK
ncbi:MAG: S24 family peptidase [Saprospiraceae bacterium]|nr:S24 family peptidase [Saprospiraceae bacterium]